MKRTLPLLAGLLTLGTLFLGMGQNTLQISEEARRIHEEALVIDGHNDLPWQLREIGDLSLTKTDLNKHQAKFHTDIPRLKKGGVGAQFWSAYVPVEFAALGTAVSATYEQIAVIHRMVEKYPGTFEMALTAADVRRIRSEGKIASMIGVEGGHSINNSLDTLRDFAAKGVRYMTLTHSANTSWADACTDKENNGGLSKFGEEVVAEMNKLGMFVDISHVSAKTMRHVLRVTKAPVMASHSSAYAVKQHVRNVPDDVLKLVAQNGGVVMVNFFPAFIGRDERRLTHYAGAERTAELMGLPGFIGMVHDHDLDMWNGFLDDNRFPRADVGTVVDHLEHIIQVAGVDHVGLGSDFDGVPYMPEGLEDVSKYPAITEELLRRGHSAGEIKKILGENLLRAFERMQAVAQTLQ